MNCTMLLSPPGECRSGRGARYADLEQREEESLGDLQLEDLPINIHRCTHSQSRSSFRHRVFVCSFD